MTGVDPLVLAQSELQANMVPTPEDVLQDVGPFAQLWYAAQTVNVVLATMTAMVADLPDDDPAATEVSTLVLQGLTLVSGELGGVCVTAGLLPPDAAPPS